MKKCRKCNSNIPNRIVINGVQKNLQNRKFCLDCSPWKNHNTSPIDPNYRVERSYKKCSDLQKEKIKLILYKRALERKCLLVEKSGGKCISCGYDKNRRALTFHHIDAKTKKFGLSLNNLWSKSWEVILEEWEKCEMLCMNCHTELEDEISRKTSIVGRLNALCGTSF